MREPDEESPNYVLKAVATKDETLCSPLLKSKDQPWHG